MITIKKYGNAFTSKDVEMLTKHFNSLIDKNIEIRISFHEMDDKPYHAMTHIYNDDNRFKSNFINSAFSSESIMDAIQISIESHLKYSYCKHSDLKPHRTREGVLVTNGVMECSECGMLTLPLVEERCSERRTILLSAFGRAKERYYTTSFNWSGITIQGSDSGVVISTSKGKSYATSFFEAFPTIHNVKTFIRGEGSTLVDAERDAYEKLNKIMKCKEHNWVRNDGRVERKDGYATCTECALSGHALEPTTNCAVCKSPARLTNLDKFYCDTHYNELSFDELYENDIKFNTERYEDPDSIIPIETEDELKSENFESYLSNKFYVLLRDQSLQSGTIPSKEESFYLTRTFIQIVKEHIYEIKGYANFKEIPDINSLEFKNNMKLLEKNMVEYLNEKSKNNESSCLVLLLGWVRFAGINN
ncbi:TPA: hypothetical protein RI785_002657 [Vibrio cholerae]|nr:hypothetical protein [Vibrio cholerae]